MDWLKQIAPTAATLLGGPMAGVAVDMIGKALGMTDATKEQVKEVLSAGTLNASKSESIDPLNLSIPAELKHTR